MMPQCQRPTKEKKTMFNVSVAAAAVFHIQMRNTKDKRI